ncbi:MAG TPA: tetratricopeptide repeat protein, partial [Candidatus Krumholzibacteria bacterium]|nr:tetratricopeptide repeat protein [Candidatus Krumholzibacteria bacterium]
MNEKAASAQQKAMQERKRGHFDKAVKRLEQTIAQFPDELDLYLDAVDACLEGGEVMQATNFLKTAQEKFTKDKDRVGQFVRDKLLAVHDPALARYVVENAVKRRDLDAALEHLEQIPDHVARDLLARTKTKKQSLKSASHGGYSLRAEIFTNDLLSALLSVRLGSMKEGMAALVEIIDEKPVETKMLLPFLAGLESKHAKVGRVRFAHACALWSNGNENDAIARIVEAARYDSTAIPLCVDRLTSLRDKTKFPPKVERALAEVLLLKGDFDAAAPVLRGYMADNKDTGREVIMLLKPYIDPAHGVNECVWVALDAALGLDQSAVAMEILRPLHQRGNCTPEVYSRLQERSKDGLFTTEVMLFHASLALELKDFPRAVELLNIVVTSSPQDVHSVVGLADKHRTSHPGLEELCRKHMAPEVVEAIAEEGDFQNFDHNEFSLRRDAKADGLERSSSAPRPSSPKPQGEKPASRFAEERKKPAEKQSFIETRELSFDDEGTIEGQVPDLPVENPSDEVDADVFETSREVSFSTPRKEKPAQEPMFKAPEQTPDLAPDPEPEREPEPVVEHVVEQPAVTAFSAPQARPAVKMRASTEAGVTESHVNNVARRLGEVGAAAFFHIDDEPEVPATPPEPAPAARAPIDAMSYVSPVVRPSAPEPVVSLPVEEPVEAEAPAASFEPIEAPEPVVAVEPVETPAPAVAIEPFDSPAPAPKTFDSELARFRKGELSSAESVALVEQAVEIGRVEDLHDLL